MRPEPVPQLKVNLALALALVAVALSGFAVVRGGRATAAPAFVRTADAGAGAACVGDGAVETLGDLMETRIHGAMTRLSYALFHDRGEPAARLEVATREAGRIAGCLEMAATYERELPAERRERYLALLDRAIADAGSVRLAAIELDEVAAAHWFLHLRDACSRCHLAVGVEGSR